MLLLNSLHNHTMSPVDIVPFRDATCWQWG